MSAGDQNANHPPRITGRESVLLVLALAGGWLAVIALIGGCGWVGYAITGRYSAGAAGGGIGLLISLVVLDVVLFKHSAIERGCLFVIFVVVLVAAYFAARDVDKKLEEERSRNAIAVQRERHT